MSESIDAFKPNSNGENVYSIFDLSLQREIDKYNKSQPTDLGVLDDSFVYPGELMESNIETIVSYAQGILEYWSVESENSRIKNGSANFRVDRTEFSSFKKQVQDSFGNRAFSLYRALDFDRKNYEAHKQHALSVPYLVAIAERFMELRGGQGK